eukprot:scaffold3749_cov119-Isochrysis_galbana.AAC.5
MRARQHGERDSTRGLGTEIKRKETAHRSTPGSARRRRPRPPHQLLPRHGRPPRQPGGLTQRLRRLSVRPGRRLHPWAHRPRRRRALQSQLAPA